VAETCAVPYRSAAKAGKSEYTCARGSGRRPAVRQRAPPGRRAAQRYGGTSSMLRGAPRPTRRSTRPRGRRRPRASRGTPAHGVARGRIGCICTRGCPALLRFAMLRCATRRAAQTSSTAAETPKAQPSAVARPHLDAYAMKRRGEGPGHLGVTGGKCGGRRCKVSRVAPVGEPPPRGARDAVEHAVRLQRGASHMKAMLCYAARRGAPTYGGPALSGCPPRPACHGMPRRACHEGAPAARARGRRRARRGRRPSA
jgi:hypothetical protein